MGKVEDAVKRLEEVLDRFPNHLATSVEIARFKLLKNDPDGAEEVLRKLTATVPDSAEAAIALGHFYLLRRKMELGEAEFRRALQLEPKNGTALLGLAAIQSQAGRNNELEETYRRLSELPDVNYKPLHALFLLQQNKRDAALAEFQKLAAQDPEDRNARSRLVSAYVLLNRIPEAQAILANTLKKNPKDLDALLQRSQLSIHEGNITRAEDELHHVLKLKPDSAEAHFEMARVYGAQHRT